MIEPGCTTDYVEVLILSYTRASEGKFRRDGNKGLSWPVQCFIVAKKATLMALCGKPQLKFLVV